jgi:outer membrane biosynthesis protein TonB
VSADLLPVPAEATQPAAVSRARGAILSLVPPPGRARRAPFVVLVLVLLASGLVGLLLLNTASAQDAFRLHALQSEQATLEQQRQAYARSDDGLSDPARLAARARALGLVPGGTPVFLAPGQPIPKGAIRIGDLVYVPGAVPVPPPAPAPAPKPSASTSKTAKKPTAKKPATKKPATKKPASTKRVAKRPVATVPGTGSTAKPTPAPRTRVAPKPTTTKPTTATAGAKRTTPAATPATRAPTLQRTPASPAAGPTTGIQG